MISLLRTFGGAFAKLLGQLFPKSAPAWGGNLAAIGATTVGGWFGDIWSAMTGDDESPLDEAASTINWFLTIIGGLILTICVILGWTKIKRLFR